MARRTEAMAVFGLSPCRRELFVMTTEPTLHCVRAVFSGGETCGHHPDLSRPDPVRNVANLVACRGVRVVYYVDHVEATFVSALLPGGVACCAFPPRTAFDAASVSALSSPTTTCCAHTRACGMFMTLAWEDDDAEGGGDPCAVCLGPEGGGPGTPSAFCGTGVCPRRFHGECILSWLEVRGSCPVCRRPVGASETVFIRTRHA